MVIIIDDAIEHTWVALLFAGRDGKDRLDDHRALGGFLLECIDELSVAAKEALLIQIGDAVDTKGDVHHIWPALADGGGDGGFAAAPSGHDLFSQGVLVAHTVLTEVVFSLDKTVFLHAIGTRIADKDRIV